MSNKDGNGKATATQLPAAEKQSVAEGEVLSANNGRLANRIWWVSKTLDLISGNDAFYDYLQGRDFTSRHLQEVLTVVVDGSLQTIPWSGLYSKALAGHEFSAQIIGSSVNSTHVAIECISLNPLKDGNGTIAGVACIGRCTTEADEETDILNVLENAIGTGADAAYIWRRLENTVPEYQIVYANAPFEKLTGYSLEESLGRSPVFTVGSQMTPELRDELLVYLAEGRLYNNDLKHEKKDGTIYWVNALSIPVRSRNGNIAIWVTILRDISIQKAEATVHRLASDFGKLFAQNLPLQLLLEQTLQEMAKTLGIQVAEVWLTSYDKKHLELKASYAESETFNEVIRLGIEKKRVDASTYWPRLTSERAHPIAWHKEQAAPPEAMSRVEAFRLADLSSVCIYPLIFADEIVGSLVIGTQRQHVPWSCSDLKFEELLLELSREIKRKRQEMQLKALVDTMPDYIAITSFDGYYVMVNPAACKITGYTEEELTSLPFAQLIHPDDLESTSKVVEDLASDKLVVHFENRQITKDGRTVWLEWNAFLLKEENLMIGVARDVTDLKRMQRILDHASQLSRMGAWEMEPETMKSTMSEVAAQILGVDSKSPLSKELRESLFGSTPSGREYLRQLRECVSKGTPVDVVAHAHTLDGQWRWMRIRTEAEMIGGKCVKVYGSVLDITKQKEIEQSLLEAKQRFELVAEATQEAIWDWEIGKEEVFRGPGYTTLFGEDISEPYTFDIWVSKIHEDDRAQVMAQVSQVMDDPSCRIYTNNYRYQRADGTYAYVSDSIRILRDEDGKAIRLVGAISDVSAFKKYEDSLKELNRQLRIRTQELVEKNKDLEQFAYAASHDLQEPLRTVSRFLGMIELKYNDLLDEKGKQYIRFASDGARRMDKMIAHLLEYSRAGNAAVTYSEVNLNSVLGNVLRLLEAQINETRTVIAADDLPTVKGVEAQWQQIFQNLLTNAIKYRKPDTVPSVHVFCKRESDAWHFEISDNGIGIDKTNLERVFVIFQRLHTQEEIPGSGIGLAITKKLVQRMGGKIWVESELGKGSVFHITVPFH